METLVTGINFLFPVLIISSPVLLIIILEKLKIRRLSLSYFLTGLFLLALLLFLFAGWGEISGKMLLNHYGYSFDGMNYENVSTENRERVDSLVTNITGIGWPLKAIAGFVMTIPYLIIVFIGKVLIDRIKHRKN